MDDKPKAKWVAFDPTIHLGHILTAFSVICSAIGLYYSLTSRVEILETSMATEKLRLQEFKIDYKKDIDKLSDRLDMWFTRLDDKLDRKADKK